MDFIAKLPELLNASASRSVSRRQTRLQRLKSLLIKNALDKHFSIDEPTPPERPPSLLTTGQNPHGFIIFDDLVQTSSFISSSSKIKVYPFFFFFGVTEIVAYRHISHDLVQISSCIYSSTPPPKSVMFIRIGSS